MHTHEDLVSVEPKRGIERGHIGNPHTRVEHVDEILHVFRGPLSKAWAWRVILKTISVENWTSVAKAGRDAIARSPRRGHFRDVSDGGLLARGSGKLPARS
jgi:uncharacterized membrane protein